MNNIKKWIAGILVAVALTVAGTAMVVTHSTPVAACADYSSEC